MGVAWPRETTADGSSTTGVADLVSKNTSSNTTSAMTTIMSFLTSQCSSRQANYPVARDAQLGSCSPPSCAIVRRSRTSRNHSGDSSRLACDGCTTYCLALCGSGIFLVGLFNRTAEEWKQANPEARNDRRARVGQIEVQPQNPLRRRALLPQGPWEAGQRRGIGSRQKRPTP